MNFFYGNLEKLTVNNIDYRRVLFTGKKSQLVLMSLLPTEETGLETHKDHEQFIRVEKGEALARIGNKIVDLKDGDSIIIPCGTPHNIINSSDKICLKLYTIYSPPEHPKGTVKRYKHTK